MQKMEYQKTSSTFNNFTSLESDAEGEGEEEEEEQDDDSEKFKPALNFTYLRAVCYKGLGKFDKAEKIYKEFAEMISESKHRDIALCLFGMLSLKKQKNNFQKTGELKSKLYKLFKSNFPSHNYDHFRLCEHWDTGKMQWIPKSIKVISQTLKKLPFFKKFSLIALEGIIPKIKYETIEADRMVFDGRDTQQKILFVLTGLLEVKDYSTNIEVPRTMALLQSGDFINPGDYNGGLIIKFHTWIKSLSKVEVLTIDKDNFEVSVNLCILNHFSNNLFLEFMECLDQVWT